MKKVVLLLSILGLAACASEQPTVKDENELSPGIMQAVAGTGAVEGGSWLPEIQQHNMPADMR